MAVRYHVPGAVAALAVLAGCGNLDLDLRSLNGGASDAAEVSTAPRPDPDARGLISYPGYQVAVARPGDTVADVAARVGVSADELSRFNGLPDGVPLRGGETLVLPSVVAPQGVDVASIAGPAIERADDGIRTDVPVIAEPLPGPEPTRHRVQAGETAFSISRLYGVTPRALSDWNGLDASFTVRVGQILLIPVPAQEAPAAASAPVTTPGQGSVAPEPPSAATPLPLKDETPTAPAPEKPDLSAARTDNSRLLMPVSGQIIRPYEKDTNDGIGIAASAGSSVKAAEDGTVAAITRDTDQVPIIVLRHEGNLLTVYAGVDGVAVKKGDTVKRGETIAAVRQSNQPYLHFEVRDGFESVDPVPYLN